MIKLLKQLFCALSYAHDFEEYSGNEYAKCKRCDYITSVYYRDNV